MKNILIVILFLVVKTSIIHSQTFLDANGDGNTYELITSVLAPGANPIETPDCSHPEFGDHIDMVLDDDLNAWVFRFHIHKTPDNDRCINFDRQRNEIKTYSESPDNLLGTIGEAFEYKWKFKIDADFQASSSFTHLHQLKAVGGSEDGMPLITLTARKGSPDKLEIRYAEHSTQETIHEVDLTPFKGNWVQVTETVTYGETGSYSISITKVDGGETVMEYSNNSIRMWKTDADFIRPKWGIYRSLNNSDNLRDEIVLFANFSITESHATGLMWRNETYQPAIFPNPTNNHLKIKCNNQKVDKLTITNLGGKKITEINQPTKDIDISDLVNGIYIIGVQINNNFFTTKIIKK